MAIRKTVIEQLTSICELIELGDPLSLEIKQELLLKSKDACHSFQDLD